MAKCTKHRCCSSGGYEVGRAPRGTSAQALLGGTRLLKLAMRLVGLLVYLPLRKLESPLGRCSLRLRLSTSSPQTTSHQIGSGNVQLTLVPGDKTQRLMSWPLHMISYGLSKPQRNSPHLRPNASSVATKTECRRSVGTSSCEHVGFRDAVKAVDS